MPIYEYQCTACGHELEAIQKMSDEALTDCPVCQKATLTKLVSAAGFQLKGTGWYATDFRNKGKPEVKTESTVTKESGEGSASPTTSVKDEKSSSSSSTTGGTT